MKKPFFYTKFEEKKSEDDGKTGVIKISIEKPTEKGWKPYYFRSYPSDGAYSQRIRRKNHKILDSLLKKENVVGTKVEVILEKEYRAGFGFEEGNSIGPRGFSFGATELDLSPVYNPVWHPDNQWLPCTESRYIQGTIEFFELGEWSVPAWLLLKYEEEKYLQLISSYIQDIKVLK